jgi:flagellar hook-associated protein 3 FlgL
MSRIATITLDRIMSDGARRTQQALAVAQTQFATHSKAPDYASLGTDTVRNLSANSLAARQAAYVTSASQVSTTLLLYDANMEAIDASTMTLREQILTAIGTGNADGLQASIESSFHQYRAALNAAQAGSSMFGGSNSDGIPFTPATLADVAAIPVGNAFTDDDVQATAQISDGVNLAYSVSASSIGKGLYAAFQTLAQAGTITGTPTAAQKIALTAALGQIDSGMTSLRAVNAANGRNQAQVETLGARAADRGVLLSGIIGDMQDVDLGQVAIDITAQETLLKASYSVIAQMSSLSLLNYLS